MIFSCKRRLFVLGLLIFITACLYGQSSLTKQLPVNERRKKYNKKSFREIYKDNVKKIDDLKINHMYLYFSGQKEEYKIDIEKSDFHKFKIAITKQSKPFMDKESNREIRVSLASLVQLKFAFPNDEILISVCGPMSFWGKERNIKHAFVSKELNTLVVEEIRKIKDQKDVGWIADVLQENISKAKKEKTTEFDLLWNPIKIKKCLYKHKKPKETIFGDVFFAYIAKIDSIEFDKYVDNELQKQLFKNCIGENIIILAAEAQELKTKVKAEMAVIAEKKADNAKAKTEAEKKAKEKAINDKLDF